MSIKTSADVIRTYNTGRELELWTQGLMNDLAAARAELDEAKAQITRLALNQASVMNRNVGLRLMCDQKDSEVARLKRQVTELCIVLSMGGQDLHSREWWRDWSAKQAEGGNL